MIFNLNARIYDSYERILAPSFFTFIDDILKEGFQHRISKRCFLCLTISSANLSNFCNSFLCRQDTRLFLPEDRQCTDCRSRRIRNIEDIRLDQITQINVQTKYPCSTYDFIRSVVSSNINQKLMKNRGFCLN